MDISGQLKDPTALTRGQVPSIAVVYIICRLWGRGYQVVSLCSSKCDIEQISDSVKGSCIIFKPKTHHSCKMKLIEFNIYFEFTIKLRKCVAGLVPSRGCVKRRIRTNVQCLLKIIARFIGPLLHSPVKVKKIPL